MNSLADQNHLVRFVFRTIGTDVGVALAVDTSMTDQAPPRELEAKPFKL